MSQVVSSLDDVRSLIRANLKGPLAWVGKRWLDAAGLERLVPIPLIFCCDSGSDATLFGPRTAMLALENVTGTRADWATLHLAEFLAQSHVSQTLQMLNGQLTLLPYQTTAAMEALCLERGWGLLANSMAVKGVLQDKMHFSDLLELLELPRIPGEVISDITAVSYAELSAQVASTMVVQFPASSGGKGTFLVTDEASLALAVAYSAEKGTQVRVSAFIEGSSPNINAVTTRHGVITAPFSHQIVSVPQARGGFGAYCGNQWLFGNDLDLSREVFRQTAVLGQYLLELGYLGIFGLDFLGKYLVEINPRVNGGTQTLTQLLLERNFIPLMAFHILEMLGVDYTFDVAAYNQRLQDVSLEHFHLVLHGLDATTSVVTGDLPAGVYKLTATNVLEFVRSGYHIGHVQHADEFVITCGVPKVGLKVVPGASLVKIQGPGVIYDITSGELVPWGSRVVEAVRQALALQPLS